MMDAPYQLTDILLLLAALLVTVPLAERLRLGTVIAYLGIGVAIGPSGFGLIRDDEEMRSLADLGVVFLLFSVGLEITVERLRLFGRGVFPLAATQIVATTLILAVISDLFAGLGLGGALIVGAALSLSSTAVVLQLLRERGQLASPLGRIALAVVLFQDLAVPFMLLLLAATSGESFWPSVLVSTAMFAAFVVGIVVIERTALRPLLRLAAEAAAPEVFAAATLLLVLGVGWLAQALGLTMTLGAFVAGLLVADTEFRHQVAADIQPFRGMLLGLFFVSVGFGMDLALAARQWIAVIALTVGLIAAKTTVLLALGILFRLPWRRALAVGGLLAQGSEFAFVMLALGADRGLIDARSVSLLTVAIGLSMALTPLGALIVERLIPAANPGRREPTLGSLERQLGTVRGHVVIAGFGQVGMAVARHLVGQHVPCVVLDMTPRRVAHSRARGLPVYYGDATRIDVLRAARVTHAAALVVSVPEAATAERITAVANRAFPDLPVFTRGPDETWIDRLRAAGADAVVLESLTTAYEFAERVMLVYDPDSPGPN
jgi:CPA2 family monovalent cation:H+ antiporter-2